MILYMITINSLAYLFRTIAASGFHLWIDDELIELSKSGTCRVSYDLYNHILFQTSQRVYAG